MPRRTRSSRPSTRGTDTTQAARDAITLALITEHRRGRHPLWPSPLLVAYEPLFAGVKKRLLDKRDADARILGAFLEAIAKVSRAHPPSYLALDPERARDAEALTCARERQRKSLDRHSRGITSERRNLLCESPAITSHMISLH